MEAEVIKLESEAGFKALFQYATIAIVVANKEGQIELANPITEKLFGYSVAELIGQRIEMLIPEKVRVKHVAEREGYFHKPKARPMGVGRDLNARKKDGTIFPVEISLGYYQLGSEMLGVAFITDISERKKAELVLKQLNEDLETKVEERTLELTQSLEREKELNDMKSKFVSMASHEFRTPLSAILSSISLVEQYASQEQAEKRKKHINRIKSSVKNLTEILNDFLSLDKLEQGRVEVWKEAFNLKEFIDDIKEEVRGILKPGQHISYTSMGDQEIMQDKKILRNILLNLLSNAIKYSPIEKEIVLNTDVKNTEVSITIKDSGIGIPAEEQKHLFTKFFRAGNANNIQGTGLGLTIVKRYVELLNGTITFESVLNKGTTFIIQLPNR